MSPCLFFLLLAGCGGSDPAQEFGGEEGKKIASLIRGFSDDVTNPKELEKAFVAGAAPKGAAQKKYQGYQYCPVGKPSISGDTAKATVSFEKLSTGDRLSEKTWEFVKEGGTWKIKSAPMP
ncbi:MAG: hypothetical protein L0Z62_49950 [Gemmataceae bacterium]|nr:hypothetical protein [Gemmataceae bacterium]